MSKKPKTVPTLAAQPAPEAAAVPDAATNSRDNPERQLGGTGNPAGPASVAAEQDVLRCYPLTIAARDAFKRSNPDFKGAALLRVTAKREGFRRAGVAHAGTVDYGSDDLSIDQVEQILGEPNLTAAFVAED